MQHRRALMQPEVEYVLLAEFDIDEGSTLKHQYPAPTGTDEHLLAEHMLPDGAHDRPEDWTVFYLGQVPALVPDPSLLAKARADIKGKGRAADEGPPEREDAREAPPRDDKGLLYVMSLVRTKKDASVRRGALVKSLAIATRNPYIQIYKPLLLLALEDYFRNPSITVLANLYDSLNAVDTTGLPYLTHAERQILRTSDRKDLFEEKFPLPSGSGSGSGSGTGSRSGSTVNLHGRSSSTQSIATFSAVGSSSHDHGGGSAEGPVRPAPHRTASTASLSVSSSTAAGPATGSSRHTATFPTSSSLRGAQSTESLASIAEPFRTTTTMTTSGSSVGTSANLSREDLSLSTSPNLSRATTINSIDGDDRGGSYANRQQAVPGGQGGRIPRSPSLTFSQSSPTMVSREIGPGGRPKDTHLFETKVSYNGLSLPVKIPLSTSPTEIGDYSLIKLVQTFSGPGALVPGPQHPHLHTAGAQTPAVIVLLNAILTGQRVVFLGHGQPAGRVAELVLAACALASGGGSVLHGIEDRAFPYTNLSNLDNLQNIPGFIAGVCNPAFADRPSWWDVLCNIETGKVIVSKDLRPSPAPTSIHSILHRSSSRRVGDALANSNGGRDGVDELGILTGGLASSDKADSKADLTDVTFMQEILSAIQSHYGESVIRARFTDYIHRFIRIASRYEEEITSATTIGYPCAAYNSAAAGAGYGAQASLGAGVVFVDEATGVRELVANAARIEGWMKTPSYQLHQQSFRRSLQESPLPGVDLTHQLSRLRLTRQMSATEASLIFATLAEYTQTDEQVIALLAQLPSHQGGLLPLAFGFFHPSAEVRHWTLELFDNLSAHPTGSKFVASLNAFQRLAFARLSAERDMILDQHEEGDRERRQRDTTVTLESFANGVGGGGGAGAGPPVPVKG
ncbi:hypothetical protein JCM10908_004772 [Rhodotorula pacifica]|uniref:AFI1/MesA family protein n=1 Tax=Rhodotorula pacifica TaxID=1495444 RepID=UPI0031813F82